jgi:hypothetical protein
MGQKVVMYTANQVLLWLLDGDRSKLDMWIVWQKQEIFMEFG